MTQDAVRAQALRRLIRLERRVSTRDAAGGEQYTYALRATLNAEVKPISFKEQLLAQQFQPAEQYEFIVRHRADIEMTDRVVFKGVAYEVISFTELGRNRRTRIVGKRPGADPT